MNTKVLEKATLIMEKIPTVGFEEVVKITSKTSPLQAFIAIHSTILGPALGGIRIYPYRSMEQAFVDVLRLAEGMTYKAAVGNVAFGGGKSVIIANSGLENKNEILLEFGEAINRFGGRYIGAEDVGCSMEDVAIVRKRTPYIVGLSHEKSSGDPGRYTAWGIFRGIEVTLQRLYGSKDIKNRTIAIQGLGNVGQYLVEYLFWNGASLVVSDTRAERCRYFSHRYGVKVVDPMQIYDIPCDIFSPCALGGILNDMTISRLRCKAVVGSANNQLVAEKHAKKLQKRGILYAPDFVVNAGGMFNVATELEKEGYCAERAREKTDRIAHTLTSIYEIAEKNQQSTHEAAIALGNYRVQYGIGKRIDGPYFPRME